MRVFLSEADIDGILFDALNLHQEAIFRKRYGFGEPRQSVREIATAYRRSVGRIYLVLKKAQRRLERYNDGEPVRHRQAALRTRHKTELRKASYAIVRHLRRFGCKPDPIVDAWQNAFL